MSKHFIRYGLYTTSMYVIGDAYGALSFRPPFDTPRRMVKGGRWKVRKLKDNLGWRAWTEGKNSHYNKRFPTHAEAVKWANAHAGTNFVPEVYRYGKIPK